jgi:hypothetical protein
MQGVAKYSCHFEKNLIFNYSKRINFCSINSPGPSFPKRGIKVSPFEKGGLRGI